MLPTVGTPKKSRRPQTAQEKLHRSKMAILKKKIDITSGYIKAIEEWEKRRSEWEGYFASLTNLLIDLYRKDLRFNDANKKLLDNLVKKNTEVHYLMLRAFYALKDAHGNYKELELLPKM